jgi:predicted MFS family arabinose efflux permease
MTSFKLWMIVLGLALGVSVSNAFARFAYGLILPSMQSDLSWTYTQSGWINTANAFGYIFGAMLTFTLVGKIKNRDFYIVGLLVTAVSLLMCGTSDEFWFLTFWRVLAGIAGAPVFILGGAMVSRLFPDNPRNTALAIAGYFGGAGLGMVVSGAVLPIWFDNAGAAAWPNAWIVLGLASLAMAPASIWAAWQVAPSKATPSSTEALPIFKMGWVLCGYGLFATGYIIYLTFVVSWMQNARFSAIVISIIWALIGLGIMASPFVWKPVLARYTSGVPLALACAATGLASAIPVFYPDLIGLVISSICFGLAVFIGPSSVTSFGRENLPEPLWAKSVSLFTLIFAIGQTIGPVGAGMIGDYTGSLSVSLMVGGVILASATLIAAMQKPLSKTAFSRERED